MRASRCSLLTLALWRSVCLSYPAAASAAPRKEDLGLGVNLGNGIVITPPPSSSASSSRGGNGSHKLQSNRPSEVAARSKGGSLLPSPVVDTCSVTVSTGSSEASSSSAVSLLGQSSASAALKGSLALQSLRLSMSDGSSPMATQQALQHISCLSEPGIQHLRQLDHALSELSKRVATESSRTFYEQLPPEDIVVLWHAVGTASELISAAQRAGNISRTLSHSSRQLVRRVARRLQDRASLLVDSTMSSDVNALYLVCADRCGVVPDTFLSKVAVQLEKLSKSSQQLVVDGNEEAAALLSPTVGVTLLTVLGKLQVPGHFQLHKIFHTQLLPHLTSEMITRIGDVAHIYKWLRGMAHYSVGGEYVARITQRVEALLPQMSLEDICTLASSLQTVGKRTVAHANLRGADDVVGHVPHRNLEGVEEEYVPLTEALMLHAVQMLVQQQQQQQPLANDKNPGVEERVVSREMSDPTMWRSLLHLYAIQCRLQYPSWAVVYHVLCSQIQRGASSLTEQDILRLVTAILKRNSAVPYHPLHEVLVQRLVAGCSDPNSSLATNPSAANVALLASFLMVLPPKPQVDDTAQVAATSLHQQTHGSEEIEDKDSTSLVPQTTPRDASLGAQLLPVFRRHGSHLSPPAFVSAMCVVPLQDLPLASRQKVLQHFTNISSTLNGYWLTRGLMTIGEKCLADCDPMSIQRWMSKFADGDQRVFLRSMHLIDAVNMLRLVHVFQRGDPSTCALAKRNLLLHVTHRCTRADVSQVSEVCLVLKDVDLFVPIAFARLCQALLPAVEEGPLHEVLHAFGHLADTFTSRSYRGTYWEDIWDRLRLRVIQEAPSMTLQDTTEALNAFTKLDLHDLPLLQSIALRWWKCVKISFYATTTVNDGAAGSLGESSLVTEEAATMYKELSRTLSPTASVALLRLLSLGTLEPAAVHALTPMLSHILSRNVQELYPSSVLLLTAAIYTLTGVPQPNASLSFSPATLAVMHRVLDDCRTMLLQMYSKDASYATARDTAPEWTARVKRSTQLPPKHFIEVLIAMSLSNTADAELFAALILSGVPPKWMRSPRSAHPSELTLLLLSATEQFSPLYDNKVIDKEDEGETVEKNGASDGMTNQSKTTRKELRRAILQPLLDAVWARVEEFEAADAKAILRCLSAHFGGKDHLDSDFVARMEGHLTLLQERQRQRTATLAARSSNNKGEEVAGTPPHAPVEVSVDDLFF